MAKTKRQNGSELRLGAVVRVGLVCAMLAGAGVGFVWQKEQINKLSQEIHDRENRLGEIQAENESRRKQLAKMRLPAFLEKRIRDLNLGLAAPQPAQVWHLAEPPRPVVAPARDALWAVEDDRSPISPRTNLPLSP